MRIELRSCINKVDLEVILKLVSYLSTHFTVQRYNSLMLLPYLNSFPPYFLISMAYICIFNCCICAPFGLTK